MSWDKTKPANVKMRVGRQQILDNNAALENALARNHNFPGTAGADDGEHLKITLHAPLVSDPANEADKGFIYLKDVSGKAELFFEDEDGHVIQVTTGGLLNPVGAVLLAGAQTITGAKTFQAALTMSGANIVMAGSETVDGVDVSAHKAGTAVAQHTAGVGKHGHDADTEVAGGLINFVRSIGANGYLKFGYLTIQWGFVDPGSSKTGSVTFPTAFGSNCYNVQVTRASTTSAGSDQNLFVSSVTASGFNWNMGETATDFYWFAIGI